MYKFFCVKIFFSAFLGVYLGKELLGHVGILFSPGVIAMLFSKVVVSYITQSVRCLRAQSPTPSSTLLCVCFCSGHSSGCRVKAVSYCGFDLHSLMANDVGHLFHVLIGYSCIFFGKLSVQVHCPFIN